MVEIINKLTLLINLKSIKNLVGNFPRNVIIQSVSYILSNVLFLSLVYACYLIESSNLKFFTF